jgi:hypothetical protein
LGRRTEERPFRRPRRWENRVVKDLRERGSEDHASLGLCPIMLVVLILQVLIAENKFSYLLKVTLSLTGEEEEGNK